MSKKVALITGITGQDGAYLTELLLVKEKTQADFKPAQRDALVRSHGYASFNHAE